MFIILCVLIAYILVSPLFYFKAVKFGMKIVEAPEKAAEETVFTLPKKRTPVKMTKEQERTAQILANIERYDGTSKGQVEVKHG